MKIVGFVGPKTAGKDESAKILIEDKVARGKISFAEPLKRMCAKVFELDVVHFNSQDLKEKQLKTPIQLTRKHFRELKHQMVGELDPNEVFYNVEKASIDGLEGMIINTPRELLQIVGTNFIRDRVFTDWHVNAAMSSKSLRKLDKDSLYCVTDIRFPNEYTALVRKFGPAFTAFYVERPKAEELLATATHPSELEINNVREMINPDNVIDNSGSIKDLKSRVLNLELPEIDFTPGKTEFQTEEGELMSGRFKFNEK